MVRLLPSVLICPEILEANLIRKPRQFVPVSQPQGYHCPLKCDHDLFCVSQLVLSIIGITLEKQCITAPVVIVLVYFQDKFKEANTDTHRHTHLCIHSTGRSSSSSGSLTTVSGITSVSADKRSCETNCANLSTSARTQSHIKAAER